MVPLMRRGQKMTTQDTDADRERLHRNEGEEISFMEWVFFWILKVELILKFLVDMKT